MKSIRLIVALLVGGLGLSPAAFAQGMGASRSRDTSEFLSKIFGKNTAFSATAHIRFTDKSGQLMHEMEVAQAMLDGKVRTETDLTKMKNSQLPPDAMAHLKQMGMDHTVTLFLPAQQASYLIYPGLKAYAQMPIGKPAQSDAKPAKIEKTEIGKDTVDGHPCVKYRVTLTDVNGEQPQKFESLLWEATDLKNFPIQMEVQPEDGGSFVTQFKDIKFSKPDAALFELPTDYKRYSSPQELMMNSMRQMMPRGDE